MIDLVALRAANAKRWANAKLTRNFTPIARRLMTPIAKSRYQAVSERTGVPWAVIAVIHQRECSQDWSGSLAQGDPWNRVSVHVPAGRGPFGSWEEAAIDALVNCAPRAARNEDWDSQPGCAGLLMAMMALDPTITFTGARITPPNSPVPTEPTAPPSIANPAKGSLGAFIAGIFNTVFRRRS
jgi:hypothetical protein